MYAYFVQPNCSITVLSTMAPGYYAAAIQVEDFASPSSTTALSSVPLEFYFIVANIADYDATAYIGPVTGRCSGPPSLISLQPACVSLRTGEVTTVNVTVRMGSLISK